MAKLREFPDHPGMILVWRVSPDPHGAADYLVVGSAAEAGSAAAEAAEMAWDLADGEPTEPGDGYEITCHLMSREEFEALPEP